MCLSGKKYLLTSWLSLVKTRCSLVMEDGKGVQRLAFPPHFRIYSLKLTRLRLANSPRNSLVGFEAINLDRTGENGKHLTI